MLTLIFVILMIAVFWKIVSLALMATWGIVKVLFSFVFFTILFFILVGLLIAGLVYIALPILILVGIVALVVGIFAKAS